MKTENLHKLLRAVDQQLGGVPEWRSLILAAWHELQELKRKELAK